MEGACAYDVKLVQAIGIDEFEDNEVRPELTSIHTRVHLLTECLYSSSSSVWITSRPKT